MKTPRRHRAAARRDGRARGIEWPTMMLIGLCYALWAVSVTLLGERALPLAMVLCTLSLVLQSSLSHEAIHGHPTRSAALNAALLFPALGLFIPFLRFRDTHLAHHRDASLTDPHDDPESNFLDPADWEALAGWRKLLHQFNNTLLGRLLIGPALGLACFLRGDLAAIWAGNRAVLAGWLWHLPAVALVVAVLWAWGQMPAWAYLLCAYAALSVLKIRTFLEHRAHDFARGRSVIVEDRGVLAFLFLNNNLHAVHHMHPKVPWYSLPALYAARRARFQTVNDGYIYRSYGEVFRRHFWRAKDPVPHPLWRRG